MKILPRAQEQNLQEFKEMLEEGTKPLYEKLEEISDKVTNKQKKEEISDIIKKIKERASEKTNVKDTGDRKKVEEIVKNEKIDKKEEPEHTHDNVFCPTCNKGHVHKLDNSGLTMQCTDKTCKEKFYMIPESADYQCSTCGLPLKKPTNDKTLDACPFCGNDKLAIPINNGKPTLKFDFSKIRK